MKTDCDETEGASLNLGGPAPLGQEGAIAAHISQRKTLPRRKNDGK